MATAPLIAFLALSLSIAHATEVTRIIDDQYGDSVTGAHPVYSPLDRWTYGPNCTACNIGQSQYVVLDKSEIYNGSWHDGTLKPGAPPMNITLSFTGTSISVYCIVLNTVPRTSTEAYYNFSLDSDPVVSYNHNPDSSSDILYNTEVFSASGLENVPHTLNMVLFISNGNESLMLFDYAKYTYEDSSPEVSSVGALSSISVTLQSSTPQSSLASVTSSPESSSSSRSTPSVKIIVGAIIGGGLAVTGALLFLWCIRIRSRRKRLVKVVSGQGRSLELLTLPTDDTIPTHGSPIGSSKKLAARRRSMLVPRLSSARGSRSAVQLELGSLSPANGVPNHGSNIDEDTGTISWDARLLQSGPQAEIDTMRAEIPDVHRLQAEINVNHLRVTYEEEAPPAYFSRGGGPQLSCARATYTS